MTGCRLLPTDGRLFCRQNDPHLPNLLRKVLPGTPARAALPGQAARSFRCWRGPRPGSLGQRALASIAAGRKAARRFSGLQAIGFFQLRDAICVTDRPLPDSQTRHRPGAERLNSTGSSSPRSSLSASRTARPTWTRWIPALSGNGPCRYRLPAAGQVAARSRFRTSNESVIP